VGRPVDQLHLPATPAPALLPSPAVVAWVPVLLPWIGAGGDRRALLLLPPGLLSYTWLVTAGNSKVAEGLDTMQHGSCL
jgi:hypothetical protein